jgi:hypothetical protein
MSALNSLATLLGPVVALIAALVSYKAVTTGPRIQREIAWTTDFRAVIAEALALVASDRALPGEQRSTTSRPDSIRGMETAQAKIALLVSEGDDDEFRKLFIRLLDVTAFGIASPQGKAPDDDSAWETRQDILAKAREVILRREHYRVAAMVSPRVNWRRGLLRAWMVLGIIWVIAAGLLQVLTLRPSAECFLNGGVFCDLGRLDWSEWLAIARFVLGPPIIVLVFGIAIRWVVAGFRS